MENSSEMNSGILEGEQRDELINKARGISDMTSAQQQQNSIDENREMMMQAFASELQKLSQDLASIKQKLGMDDQSQDVLNSPSNVSQGQPAPYASPSDTLATNIMNQQQQQ